MQRPVTLGIGHAHLQHAAVAVQVLRRVLVEKAVTVLIDRAHVPAMVLGRVDRDCASVGVHDGHDIERARVHELGDRWIATVSAHDAVEEGQRTLAAQYLPAVDVAVHVEARLLGRRPGGGIVHIDCPDRSALAAAPDDLERHQLRILRGQCLEVASDLVQRVVVIKRDQASALGGTSRRNEQRGDQQ